jgi:hypothetical protein
MSAHSGDGATDVDPAVSKQQWVQQHANHMLQHWRQWHAPLGVAPSYIAKLEEDLAKCYDQPLLKTFIERTY